jgi:uroporphyrinogen-III synthase
MSGALDGKRVALAEGRQVEELAALLEKEGATALRYPLLAILDAPDPAPIRAWLADLYADRFHYAVFLTGEGIRRMRSVTEAAGQGADYIAALGRVIKVTRGPKPMVALRELGLAPDRVAETPTTDGVIATLSKEPLAGKVVGVQLYAPENARLLDFLAAAGATARTVLPYVVAPASDATKVVELIRELAAGRVDCLVFTSSPQVDRLHEVAKEANLEAELRQGYERVCVASVGPLVTEALKGHGVRIDVQPERGFQMKNLVQHIKRHFESGATE